MNCLDDIKPEIKDSDNLDKSISQETSILNKKKENLIKYNVNNYINNNNSKINTLPIFKNRLKALFNEFSTEEGNNIEPAINFSEKILELPEGWTKFIIFIIISIVCFGLIVLFPLVKKSWLIPIPALGLIVSVYLMKNLQTIQPGEALVLTYYGNYMQKSRILLDSPLY